MTDFIKDADCTKETPVRLGVPDAPIYGKGIKLKPMIGIILLVHFMVLTVVHVRKKVIM